MASAIMRPRAEKAAGNIVWGDIMQLVKAALPVIVALAVVSAVTAVLWYFKLAMFGPDHPVFFYLLPIALVTIFYGSVPALLGILTATLCADFFLYDPLYSFDISSRVEFGDLSCFAFLALIGVKCASELFWRSAGMPAPKSRYGRS
jgi:K+-sensing histidine kinase KdpD